MLSRVKERLYEIFSIKDPDDTATRLVNGFLIVLVVINVAAFVLQTFEDIATGYAQPFYYLEVFSVAAFTVEYVLRVWVADLDPEYAGPIAGRLRYMFTDVLAIVDLVAILPFYLPGVLPFDLLAIRVLRLFRLARLAKLTRYTDSLDLIVRVITKQREFLVITFTIQMILLLVSAAVMYYLEHEAQPEKFTNILSALTWGLGAVAPVANTNIYPVTALGKIVGPVLAFVEVVAMALPIGVIAAGIEQEMDIAREKDESAKKDQLRKRYLMAARSPAERRSK